GAPGRPGRRRPSRRAGPHPRDGRGAAARRRGLRGLPAVRGPGLRPRRAPGADDPQRAQPAPGRVRPRGAAGRRRAPARGGAAGGRRPAARVDPWRRAARAARGAPRAAAGPAAGHGGVRPDAAARPDQVALLRGEHARHAPGQGAGRRPGPARHAARPRARGADVDLLLRPARGGPRHPAPERPHPRLDHPPRRHGRLRGARAGRHPGRARAGRGGVPGLHAARGPSRVGDRRAPAVPRPRPDDGGGRRTGGRAHRRGRRRAAV
ncbi:MAG: Aminodeoxychorismate lyase, partial [uncultured Solirubrobacteraceae bacterium]